MNADGKPMDLPNCKPEEAEFIPVITNEGVQYWRSKDLDNMNLCIKVKTRYLCNPLLHPKCLHDCGCFLGPSTKGMSCYCTTNEKYAYTDSYGKPVRVSPEIANDDELLRYSGFFRCVYKANLRKEKEKHE